MITDVYVVINNKSEKDLIAKTDIKRKPFFYFIDESTKEGLKEGRKFRYSFGTKEVPFAVCYDHNKPIKAFYGESKINVIQSLIDFLNG